MYDNLLKLIDVAKIELSKETAVFEIRKMSTTLEKVMYKNNNLYFPCQVGNFSSHPRT